MTNFLIKNWFQILLAVSILWGFYRSWRQGIKQKELESNHIHTLENSLQRLERDIIEIRTDIDELRKETSRQGERISRLEGKLNGR